LSQATLIPEDANSAVEYNAGQAGAARPPGVRSGCFEVCPGLGCSPRKWRPDWDITTPGFKADWEKGERGRFYPYGKTYGQVFQEQE
jgi:hypothetical protein